jgi:hypothetical protein
MGLVFRRNTRDAGRVGRCRLRRHYEGYLMTAAGAAYIVGRESRGRYNEPLAGRQDHWPNQLYVREGRRLVGEYILSERDLEDLREKYDSIGMAGYIVRCCVSSSKLPICWFRFVSLHQQSPTARSVSSRVKVGRRSIILILKL